jgi:undecaprenyl-diphosphatase
MSLGGLLARSIKVTVKEPRPYEVDTRIAQLSDGGSNSFPSGHTVEVSAAMMGIALLLYRTPITIALSILWAILMMYSRIVLGVHNFTDIAGGIMVGCIGLLIVQKIFDRFYPNQ